MPPASSPQPPVYDALLVVSFGGPDGPEDVIPFLENVLRGRNVPRTALRSPAQRLCRDAGRSTSERLLEVAEHYRQFGGRSPINDQNRALVAAIERDLKEHGPLARGESAIGGPLRVYWGNRNWHPLLADTLRQMAADGVRRALAFVTSAFSSYSGCRQYREDIARAQQEVGPTAPQVDKLRVYFNHPGFIEPMVERTRTALDEIPAEVRDDALLVFTAHSIPQAMAENCRYEEQLREACRLVAEGVGRIWRSEDQKKMTKERMTNDEERVSSLGISSFVIPPAPPWHLVYQSRSGPPSQPWLEPDVTDFLTGMKGSGFRVQEEQKANPLNPEPRTLNPSSVVLVPIGFISDHMEVVYDLDTEARATCDRLGIRMVRAATVGTHPRFVRMIRELVVERMSDAPNRLALGALGPSHDVCPDDCCLYSPHRPASKP